MKATRRTRWAVAACTLALTAAAGCSAAPQAPHRTPVPVPTVKGTTGLHLPTEPYMLPPDHPAKSDWTPQNPTRPSLKRYGFAPPPPTDPPPDGAGSTARSFLDRRYGVSDPDSIGKW